MNRNFASLLACLITCVITLSACGPIYKTEYRFQPPPDERGRICANACLDKMQSCQSSCKTQNTECRHIKSLEAENAYLHYVNERQREDKEVEKSKRDFENYSDCNTGCSEQCESIHRICHMNCGGNVTETRYCTAFCD